VNGPLTREQLREIQGPPKERYRGQPDAALITLEALAACAGVTMRSVATSMELEVSGTVHAEGDLDWRGTLAVDPSAPVGFKAIRLSFELESDASDEEIEKLQELTERYCVVYQTLAGTQDLSVSPRRS
jgi:uncharacterized OsmC-like protein